MRKPRLPLALKTVCLSGQRGWTQLPLAQAAWGQIPQLSYPLSLPCLDTARDNMSFPLLGALIMLPRRSWQSIRVMSAWSWVRSSHGGFCGGEQIRWCFSAGHEIVSGGRHYRARNSLHEHAGEEETNPCMFPCPRELKSRPSTSPTHPGHGTRKAF